MLSSLMLNLLFSLFIEFEIKFEQEITVILGIIPEEFGIEKCEL